MVGVVQLAEHWIVVPGVVGSSPITHPIKRKDTFGYPFFLYFVRKRGLEQSNATRMSVACEGSTEQHNNFAPKGKNANESHHPPDKSPYSSTPDQRDTFPQEIATPVCGPVRNNV